MQKQLAGVGRITFASGSAVLTSHDKAVAKQIAKILVAHPGVRLKVEGNTDSTGSAAFNLTMSRARARAVVRQLRALGVARSRLTVIGYGETHPKVANDTPRHRAINRRVDLVAATPAGH